MSQEQNKFIQLYEPVWGNSFPATNYFLLKYNSIPNIVQYYGSYGLDLVNKLIEVNKLTLVNTRESNNIDGGGDFSWILESSTYNPILMYLSASGSDSQSISEITIYHRESNDIIKIRETVEMFNLPEKIGHISIITKDEFGLSLKDYETKGMDKNDIETNYNDDFLPIHDKIINKLNSKFTSGLVLLHGEPGTGKTTYIKSLTHFIDGKVIFVPPFMAKVLTDPAFVPFLMRYPNSVLVIEDAENVILDRSSNGDSEAVSNILNITDGILGDCMNVKIVATFNIEKTRIDKALLRKGRLIAEYEFKELSKDKTNKILNKLYGNVVSDRGMTLSDIYNYNDIVGFDNKQTKIGF